MRKVSTATATHFTHTVKMKPLLTGYGNRPSFCWWLASLHLVLIRLGKLACLWTNKSFQSKICEWQNRVWQIFQLIHSYSPFITYARAYLLSVHNFLQTRDSPRLSWTVGFYANLSKRVYWTMQRNDNFSFTLLLFKTAVPQNASEHKRTKRDA